MDALRSLFDTRGRGLSLMAFVSLFLIALMGSIDPKLTPILLGIVMVGACTVYGTMISLPISEKDTFNRKRGETIRTVAAFFVTHVAGVSAFAILKRSIGYEVSYPGDVTMMIALLTLDFSLFFAVCKTEYRKRRMWGWAGFGAFVAAPYAFIVFARLVHPFVF